MKLLRPIFTPGETATSSITFRKNGLPYNPFSFDSVKIYSPRGIFIRECVWPFQIHHTTIGNYSIDYDSAKNDAIGAYKVVWRVKWEAYDEDYSEITKYFFLQSPQYDTTFGEAFSLTFNFNLITSNLYVGEKRFVRINVKEMYSRLWNGNAQMKIIKFHNKWKKTTIIDWTECAWENQEMICMFDTNNIEKGEYLVQIRLDVNNGETILSPLMTIDLK